MTKRTECTARQYSDQMQCAECALQWDMNDPEPPKCLTQTEKQMVDIAKDLEVPVHTLIGKKVGQRPYGRAAYATGAKYLKQIREGLNK